MNKVELIATIAQKSGLDHAQVESAIQATFDTIAAIIAKQDKASIPGFGSFSVKKRPARKGRNPSTGEEILIQECTVASFKPASQLKELINAKEK